MNDLLLQIQELLEKSRLMRVKAQQGPIVASPKGATTPIKGPSATSFKAPSFTLPTPASPFAVGKVPAPKPIAGQPPPGSKKDPVKQAEQLKSGHPQKATVEKLEMSENGQWSLVKAQSIGSMETVRDESSPNLGGRQDASAPNLGMRAGGGRGTGGVGSLSNRRRPPKIPTAQPTIDSATQGFKSHSPEQHALVHGLELHKRIPLKENAGLNGAAEITNPLHGGKMIVKNSTEHMDRQGSGHLRRMADGNTFNSARREVLFHDMAHRVFGLGKHVPLTAGFTDNNSHDWSAQKFAHDAGHALWSSFEGVPRTMVPNHQKVITDLNNSGELDKIAIMDHLLGNNDRHTGNFMVDNNGDGFHLVDNGAAFDYGNVYKTHQPHYRMLAQGMNVHGEDGHEGRVSFHPKAVEWAQKLNPDDAMKVFAAHGHGKDSPAIKGFMNRLNHLQAHFKTPMHFLKKPDKVLQEGRISTEQRPEEYW